MLGCGCHHLSTGWLIGSLSIVFVACLTVCSLIGYWAWQIHRTVKERGQW